jgi:hypothetical protein
MAEANIVDVEFLAKFFSKDVRTIQLWSKDLGMPKEDRGKYDFIKVVRWRINFLEDKIEELEKGDATLYKLKQEYQQMMNEEKKMKIEKMREGLIDAVLVKLAWISEVKIISRSIDALVPFFCKLFSATPEQRATIKSEIDSLKVRISKSELDLNDEIERELEQELKEEDENEE